MVILHKITPYVCGICGKVYLFLLGTEFKSEKLHFV